MKTKSEAVNGTTGISLKGQAKPIVVAPKSTLSPSTRKMLRTADKLLKAK